MERRWSLVVGRWSLIVGLWSLANVVKKHIGANYHRLTTNFRLDQLWAIAPFLLRPQIGVGLAFAATAALLYVPFSERTLVRLAYREG